MANCMLNLASSPVCGRALRKTLVLRRLVDTVIAFTSSARKGRSRNRSSAPSIARCVQ